MSGEGADLLSQKGSDPRLRRFGRFRRFEVKAKVKSGFHYRLAQSLQNSESPNLQEAKAKKLK